MNSTGRRIEIFAPFGEAVEVMKKILFQPFSFRKWFVIGFAAWLATFFGGMSFNYRYSPQRWRHLPFYQPDWSLHDLPVWVFPVVTIGGLCLLAFLVLIIWLNARARFIFIDCIVRNRAAIVVPWHENATEADRFFLFRLAVTIIALFFFGFLAVIFYLSRHGGAIIGVPLIIIFGIGWLVVAITLGLVMLFMVPVMYRQRCTTLSAFRQVWDLMVENPLTFILFVLFAIVLYIAALLISCLVGCLTCCIAALPYIGTVILLPVVLTLYAFPLCFLRQFGNPYDVWAVITTIEPPPSAPPPSPPPPPVQLPPSP